MKFERRSFDKVFWKTAFFKTEPSNQIKAVELVTRAIGGGQRYVLLEFRTV